MPNFDDDHYEIISNQKDLFQWFADTIKVADTCTPPELVALFDAIMEDLGADGVWSYFDCRRSFGREVRALLNGHYPTEAAPVARFVLDVARSRHLALEAGPFKVHHMAAVLVLVSGAGFFDAGTIALSFNDNGDLHLQSHPGVLECEGADIDVSVNCPDRDRFRRMLANAEIDHPEL